MKSAPVPPRAADIERRTPNIEHPSEEELTFRFLHFDVGSSKLDDGIAEAMRRDAELDRDPSAGMSLEEFRSALGR